MVLEDSNIEYIKKQYLCCAPINKFSFKEKREMPEEPIEYETQRKIFENTIQDPISLKYPSGLSYRIAFLRALVQKLEKDGEEIYDKIYETLANYMTLKDDENPTHYKQFLLKHRDKVDRIILKESKNLISEGTTGLRTWQAGFALAEWCCLNESRINEKLVIELGSGVGLTGLTVIKTCSPKRYTFTDCHSSVLDMLVKNVRLNFVKDNDDVVTSLEAMRTVEWNEESYKTTYRTTDVRINRLAWSSINDESDVAASWTNPDVVLAADVIYDPSNFDELIKALKIFINRSNALVIVAATVRNDDTLSDFLQKLAIQGLSHTDEDVPSPNLFLHLDDTPVRILKIFADK